MGLRLTKSSGRNRFGDSIKVELMVLSWMIGGTKVNTGGYVYFSDKRCEVPSHVTKKILYSETSFKVLRISFSVRKEGVNEMMSVSPR